MIIESEASPLGLASSQNLESSAKKLVSTLIHINQNQYVMYSSYAKIIPVSCKTFLKNFI